MWASLELLSWTSLRGWGNHRLVRTSWIWVILVPVLGKLLSPNSGRGGPVSLSGDLKLDLGLPFNWMTFYFMTLAFTMGHALYAFRCPEVVRKFETFSDYRASHLGITNLIHVLAELIRRMSVRDLDRFHAFMRIALQMDSATALESDKVFEQVAAMPNFTNRMSLFAWYRELLVRTGNEGLLNDAFDVIREHAGRVHRLSIVASSVSFRIGFLALLLVILQTCLSVARLISIQGTTLWNLIAG